MQWYVSRARTVSIENTASARRVAVTSAHNPSAKAPLTLAVS